MVRAVPWLVRTESTRRRSPAERSSMFRVCVYVDAGLIWSFGFSPSSKMKVRPVACRRNVRRRASDDRPPRPATAWAGARGAPGGGCGSAAGGGARLRFGSGRKGGCGERAREGGGEDEPRAWHENDLLGWTGGGGGPEK